MVFAAVDVFAGAVAAAANATAVFVVVSVDGVVVARFCVPDGPDPELRH